MDFDRSDNAYERYQYRHDHDHDSHRWSVDSSVDSAVYSPMASSRSPSMTAMSRFLQEQDGPFFTTTPTLLLESEFAANPFGPSINARLPSPAYTSNADSWSDQRDTPPFASPEIQSLPYSPFASHNEDMVPFAFGGNPPAERRDSHFGGCCVAMTDVQKMADDQPASYHFDDEPAYNNYGCYTQEGYQPMGEDDSQSTTPHSSNNSDYYPQPIPQRHDTALPVIRRRRPQHSRNVTSPAATARVSKRPLGRRSSSYQSAEDVNTSAVSSANRAFPCTLSVYGCTSSFGSKNEWKRHVTTQHMRLGFWRCDLCTNNHKPNDFNRKDLFTQHVRRMHQADSSRLYSKKSASRSPKEQGDDLYLQDAATRCYRMLRTPPQECRCLFCDKVFRGHGAWDDRMEHVGRHMEQNKKEGEEPVDPRKWKTDEMAQQWMINQGILLVIDGEWVLAP